MGGACRMEGNMHTGFWWGKRPPGRHRYRWEDGVKVDLKQDGRACMGLIWLRIRTTGMLL